MARGRKKQKITRLITNNISQSQNQNTQNTVKIQRRGRKKKIIQKRGRKKNILSAHKNKYNSNIKQNLLRKRILSQIISNQKAVSLPRMQQTMKKRERTKKSINDLRSIQNPKTSSEVINIKNKPGRKPKNQILIQSLHQDIINRSNRSNSSNEILQKHKDQRKNSLEAVGRPKTRSVAPITIEKKQINNQTLKSIIQKKKEKVQQLIAKKRGRKPKTQSIHKQSISQQIINQRENMLNSFINTQDQMRLTRGKKQLNQKQNGNLPNPLSFSSTQKKGKKGIKILKELKQKGQQQIQTPLLKKKITKQGIGRTRGTTKTIDNRRAKRFLSNGNSNKSNLKQIKSELKQIIQQKRRGRGRKLKKRRGRPRQLLSDKRIQQKQIQIEHKELNQEPVMMIKRKPGRPPKNTQQNQPIIHNQINFNVPFVIKKQQFRPYDQQQTKIVDKFLQDLIQIRKIKSVLEIYSNRSQIYDFIKDSCKYGQLGKINHIPNLKQVQQTLEKKITNREFKPHK